MCNKYGLLLWLFAISANVHGNDAMGNIKLNNMLSACLAVDQLGDRYAGQSCSFKHPDDNQEIHGRLRLLLRLRKVC